MSGLSGADLGLVETPPETARYVVSRLGRVPPGASVLDPCAGPGAFPRALLDAGVEPDQITAWDIDGRHRGAVEALGVKFEQKDALLSLDPFSYCRFDFVVGNPPYLSKGSEYIRRHREQLRKIYGSVGAHEAYAMFVVNGVRRLREGGRLAFVVSDSFLTLNTHARFRRYLLTNCRVEEIALAPEGLFSGQGVSTSACVLTLTKCTGTGRRGEREFGEVRGVPRLRSQAQYWDPPEEHRFPQREFLRLPHCEFFARRRPGVLRLFEEAGRLSDHLEGHIGLHTGANEECIAVIEGAWPGAPEGAPSVDPAEVDGERWKPYLKTGGSERYWRPVFEALRWDEGSRRRYHIPSEAPFGEEGLVVSGVSSRLAARYMPPRCWWDSNKCIGFVSRGGEVSLEYALGLLNTPLYDLLAKGVLNRTNCVQISDLRALPLAVPPRGIRREVESLVSEILERRRADPPRATSALERRVDRAVADFHRERFGVRGGANRRRK